MRLPAFFANRDIPAIVPDSLSWQKASWAEALGVLTLTATAPVAAFDLSQVTSPHHPKKLSSKPETRNPKFQTLHLNSKPEIINPIPETANLKPQF